jgi:serine/threonine protein kinase
MMEGSYLGAYRVLQRIGEGGMGSVWLAEHSMLGRRAAIKVLHPSFSADPAIVTRFFNEARAATAIADPGIVQIFDFGQQPDGSAYIVMELLEGEALDRRVARLGRLNVGDALRIMRQAASSLGAAHARGIVHRDLKPENIFIVRDPEVAGGERAKILDFGIAKLVGDPSMKTQTSAVMGTPTYMSPEQCRGAGQVDQRSDVYALGCVLFALLVGRPPFEAVGIGDIIAMHLREPPPVPSMHAPGIPPEVDAIVARCLAKDPAQRFSTAAELAQALGSLLGSVPAAPVGAFPNLPASRTMPTTLSSAAGVATRSATPRSRAVWILGSLAVVGAAGGIFVAAHGLRADQPDARPVPAVAPAPPATPPPPPPSPPRPDPGSELAPRMKAVLARFAEWSSAHAGEPCPELAALGGDPLDPWHHPFALTCTDQPADQVVGLVSAGPDGVAGNDDDVASWQLGRSVSDSVRGSRWVAAPPPPVPGAARKSAAGNPPGSTSGTAASKPRPDPRSPTQPAKPKRVQGLNLDDNGIPTDR